MLNAKSQRRRSLRIFPVPRLVSFVNQRTAYTTEADKKAAKKPRTKADYVLTEDKLQRLETNDASFKAVVEQMNRGDKIDKLITIPETEKISVKISMVDKAPRIIRMRSFPITDRVG